MTVTPCRTRIITHVGFGTFPISQPHSEADLAPIKALDSADTMPRPKHRDSMRRREFITLGGSVAAMWPFAARAQQKVPTVAILGSASAATMGSWVAAFRQRLSELGWIEGRTVAVELRWAEAR